jgi:predicted porin
MLSYRTQQYTLAGEFVSVKNGAATGSIISAFGVYHLSPPSKIAVVARVDITDPNTSTANDANTRIIAGASYQLSPNVRVLADLDRLSFQGGGTAINQFLFQAQFVF